MTPQADAAADETVEVARIVRAHGLRGELVALTHAEDAAVLCAAEQVVLDGSPGAIPFRVRASRTQQRRKDGRWLVLLELAGVAERARAEVWIGAAVRVPAAALEAARGGDLYWRDLIGLRCLREDGALLGVLREIWPNPAHDVLVVDGPDGRRLLPAGDEVLLSVDLAAGLIRVRVPEDLAVEPVPAPPQSAPAGGTAPPAGRPRARSDRADG